MQDKSQDVGFCNPESIKKPKKAKRGNPNTPSYSRLLPRRTRLISKPMPTYEDLCRDVPPDCLTYHRPTAPNPSKMQAPTDESGASTSSISISAPQHEEVKDIGDAEKDAEDSDELSGGVDSFSSSQSSVEILSGQEPEPPLPGTSNPVTDIPDVIYEHFAGSPTFALGEKATSSDDIPDASSIQGTAPEQMHSSCFSDNVPDAEKNKE